MATDKMNLELPAVSSTPGPEWAAMYNAIMELIDEHDHSSTKGNPVTPGGMNINADLPLNQNKITQILAAVFHNLSATPGSSDYNRSLFVVNGDLYFRNDAGQIIRVTSGIKVSAPGGPVGSKVVSSYPYTVVAADMGKLLIFADAGGSRVVTLPAASSLGEGPFYFKDDATVFTSLTVNKTGGDTIDGAASASITAKAVLRLYCNGSNKFLGI